MTDLEWTLTPRQDGSGSYWFELLEPWLLVVCPRDGRWAWSATSLLSSGAEPLHGESDSAEDGKRLVVQRLHDFLKASQAHTLGRWDREALARLDALALLGGHRG